MRASKMLISTLKDDPQEAKIASHVLLLRAGMIKNLVAGVYNYLPFGLRVLNKIENIVREEMDNSGALELLSSAVQPKELWIESGRWDKYGPELFRFSDRHERDFCLGPTHEEIFTDLARNLIKSPKNLPMNLYQIQTKYRDEVRPRFGLMRGREFIMKDAYSFDKDEEGLNESYNLMFDTYTRIFNRFGLNFKAVSADTGNIGGNGSHQFMALSEIGESAIVYCDNCHYAADVEKAEAICTVVDNSEMKEMKEISTPSKKTIEEVSSYLNVEAKDLCKTILYRDLEHDKIIAVMVRGDREVNEIKLVNAIGTSEVFLTLASEEDIKSLNSIHGYCGPVGLNCDIYIDYEVAQMKNMIVGANKSDVHLENVNYGRDFQGIVLDVRKTIAGDVCPVCGKPLKLDRGIEVGQIFKLQTKYSEAMKCVYTNENGVNLPMVMGCYGIGITRTMSSIVEQYHDEHGIQWPLNVAPYHCVIVPINYDTEEQKNLACKAYDQLKQNHVEVILDDRKAKPGFKFKDWDLIGIPYMIVCGKNSEQGIVELKNRLTNEKVEVSLEEALEKVVSAVQNI